ncbi:MAG: HypC/HybG/HupF family hydrogenase formation chaperone, partial [Spirochaetota bacterium]
QADYAEVEIKKVRTKVNIALIDEEINPGDYLMVHAGFAIGKINLEEAEARLKLWGLTS